jgi:NAD(P)-dependent dehydrogenase (short-subunit alcohol dehydrogenase family)
MARVLVTGSTDGLGRAAARRLIEEGHQVILHARSHERVSVLDDLASRSGGVVVGDLRSAAETRRLAAQVNAIGRMHAVIHNAGVSSTIQFQGPYSLLGARVEYGPSNRRWAIAAYARNLSNTDYLNATFGTSPVAYGGRPGPPRQFAMQFTIRR